MPSSFTAFLSFDARPLLLFNCLCLGLDDLCAFWIWGPLGNSSSVLFFPSFLLQPLTQHSQTGDLLLRPSSTPLRILWSENSVHLLCSDWLVTPLPPPVLVSSDIISHCFPKSLLHQLFSPLLKSQLCFLCTGSFSLWLEVYLEFLHLRRKIHPPKTSVSPSTVILFQLPLKQAPLIS